MGKGALGFENVLISRERAGIKRQFCAVTPKRRPLLREDSEQELNQREHQALGQALVPYVKFRGTSPS